MADIPRIERHPEVRVFSVDTLLQYVREGRVRIPVFARPSLWRASDVLDFFDSVYRGIPVGSLLFAKRPAGAGTLHFGSLQVKAPASTDALFVVDGQQRITALAATLLHPDPRPRGDIHALWFDLETQSFRRMDASEAPLHWIPLNTVVHPLRLLEWLRSWPLHAEREDLAQRALTLSTALKEYQLPAYLIEGASEDALRLVFRRINTSGVLLREVEVLEALFATREPHPIAAACLRLEETGFGPFSQEQFTRCLKAVEGWDVYQGPPGSEVETPLDPEAVERTENALRRVITFLTTEAGIPHGQLLPYWLPLVVLARFFHLTPEPSPRTRLLLSRWVWRGALSDTHQLAAPPHQIRLLAGITSNPHTSVEHLLRTVPRAPAHPTAATRWNLREAGTRLCAIALFHLGARDPETHAPLGLHDLQDLLSRQKLNQLFTDTAQAPASTVARHVLLASPEKLPLLPSAPPDVLCSHGLDPEAAEALQKQDVDTFERRRTRILDSWFERFFRERSAPDESDRPPITELIRRVDERASVP